MARRNAKTGPHPKPALRLLKTILPVALVREMDQAILATGGTYVGRDEFIAEAIRDRITEDRARSGGGGPAPVVVLEEVRAMAQTPPPTAFAPPPKDVATLPAVEVSEELYGLHNRDYPTLWAAASLASMVGAAGAPIGWVDFFSRMLEAAWSLAAQLAQLDRERSRGTMKAAVGFPANRQKRESAESRFAEHMLGVVRGDGSVRGPLFALGLAGVEIKHPATHRPPGLELYVAPSTGAVELLTVLACTDFGPRPPHVELAWRAFSTHLRAHSAADYSAWMGVLEAIEARTPRAELAHTFRARWPGSAADTNVYGYVSRGREWGLVSARLMNGEYELTERGITALQEVRRI